jgi:hypothetical protein
MRALQVTLPTPCILPHADPHLHGPLPCTPRPPPVIAAATLGPRPRLCPHAPAHGRTGAGGAEGAEPAACRCAGVSLAAGTRTACLSWLDMLLDVWSCPPGRTASSSTASLPPLHGMGLHAGFRWAARIQPLLCSCSSVFVFLRPDFQCENLQQPAAIVDSLPSPAELCVQVGRC